MIDVPVRVKDALRSGDYKKNYEIHVGQYQDDYQYISLIWATTDHDVNGGRYDNFTVDTGGKYKFATSMVRFSSLKVVYGSTEIIVDAIRTTIGSYAEVDLTANTSYTLYFYNFPAASQYSDIAYSIYAGQKFVEDFVIDNSHLVAESVKFDERMCSDTELKFGLCEGTSVEFQYFDFPNIRGQHISIELDVEYKDENNALAWYTIPMGQYDVDECSRQASTGIIKATGYNKLQSKTLDSVEYVNNIIATGESGITGQTSVYKILNSLLGDFSIDTDPPTESNLPTNTYGIVGSATMTSLTPSFKKYGGGYYTIFAAEFEYRSSLQKTNGYYKYCVNGGAIYQYIKTLLNLSNLMIGSSNPTSIAYYLENSYNNYRYDGYVDIKNTSNVIRDSKKYFAHYSPTGTALLGEPEVDPSTGLTNIVFVTNNDRIFFSLPVFVLAHDSSTPVPTHEDIEQMNANLQSILNNVTICTIINQDVSALAETKLTASDVANGVTVRDLQSSVFEINCQYGKLDRVTDLFAGIELNEGALYPRDSLYPTNNRLPMGTSEAGYPAMYSKLWADEGNVRTFRYLIITYKAMENGQEIEKKLQRTVNTNGTDDYNMSDNWLFRNLVWTAEQVGAYADAMVAKMQNISWFPFEMWCVGLPYIEAGDIIEIAMKNGTYPSPVLRRNLNGIQNLQDEMINGTLDIF